MGFHYLSREESNSVIELVEKRFGLLPYGIVAGQSVAEAVIQVMGVNVSTRMKDLDVFIKSEEDREGGEFHVSDEERILEYCSYGLTCKIRKQGYVVTHSEMQGDINRVRFYPVSSESMPYVELVINGFDINCTQAGICPETKLVVVSDSFNEFCKSKQLKAINYSTPFRSACRLLQKYFVFEDAYCDLKKQLSMLHLKSMNDLPSDSHVIVHAETVDRLSGLAQDVLSNYFHWGAVSDRPSDYGYYKVSPIRNSFYGIRSPVQYEDNGGKYYPLTSEPEVLKACELTTDGFNRIENTVSEWISREFFKKGLTYDTLIHILRSRLVLEGAGILDRVSLKSFQKQLKLHPKAIAIGLEESTDLPNYIKNLSWCEKRGMYHIAGLIESGELDPVIFSKYSREDIKEYNEDFCARLKQEYIPPCNIKTPSGWQEITNRLTLHLHGSKMRFCISGYWKRMADKNYRVFVYTDKSGKQYTAGFVKYKQFITNVEQWELEQIRGYKNSFAPEKPFKDAKALERKLNIRGVDLDKGLTNWLKHQCLITFRRFEAKVLKRRPQFDCIPF